MLQRDVTEMKTCNGKIDVKNCEMEKMKVMRSPDGIVTITAPLLKSSMESNIFAGNRDIELKIKQE